MEAILTLRIKYNLFAIIEKNQLNLWSFPIIFIFQSIKNWIDKVLLIVTQNPYELDALIFCTVFGCFMWSYKSNFNIFTSYLIMCCCQIDLLSKYFLFTGQTDGTQPLTGKSRSTATIPSPVLLSMNMQQLTIKT